MLLPKVELPSKKGCIETPSGGFFLKKLEETRQNMITKSLIWKRDKIMVFYLET